MSDWNNKNSSTLASDHGTAGNSRVHDSTGVSWSNFSGTKDSHDVEANQLNTKDRKGNHTFYSPKSGVQGQAGGERNK